MVILVGALLGPSNLRHVGPFPSHVILAPPSPTPASTSTSRLPCRMVGKVRLSTSGQVPSEKTQLNEPMQHYVFLPASLIIPVLGFRAPASAQSMTLSGFLSRCDSDPAFCHDEVSRVERMSNAIPGASCPSEDISIG